MPDSGPMSFERFGRTRHLRIETAEDLACVPDLDEAHWVATGAPIQTINSDPTFLALVDTDHNGRVMCFEVIGAIRWLLANLRDTAGVSEASTRLELAALSTDQGEAARIHGSVSRMLLRLGLEDAAQITLEQVRQVKAEVEGASVSEAGVVLPEAAGDAEVRSFIADVVATVGGAPHPSGSPGVGQAQVDDFLAQAQAHLDWLARAELAEGEGSSEVMPFGEATAKAYALYAGLRGKIDQYFAQCEAVAFDERTATRVSASDDDLQSLDLADPDAIDAFIRSSPLARPRADRTLFPEEQINPRYVSNLARLRSEVIEPALGRAARTLSEDDWREVKHYFAAHEAWLADKAGEALEPLGPEKLRRYLGGRHRAAVEELIAESAATALALDNIRLTEKLILYQAHLITLANNFVSFPHLYDPARRALFEMGTLVMDGRRFNFSVRADDRKQHAAVAATGSMYVLYAEIMPPGEGPKYEVAVPVTSGGRGNLCVGKRGIFEEVGGGECDARIVQIIDNPISLGEALVSPFRRLGRLLSGKIEAITTTAEKQLDATAAGAMKKAPAGAPAAGPSRGLMAGGLLMGGGVALAALGSAFAYIAKTLSNVKSYTTILAVVGIAILAVIVPTCLVAMRKLRRRDLSVILEGSGWAINARMRLTFRQQRYFTQRPALPRGGRGAGGLWAWLAVLAVAIAAAVLIWWLRWR